MKKFGVGIQLYGVRNAMTEDFERTLQKIADMGYGYVEFAGYHGKTGAEIKAILDRLGLQCLSVHQDPGIYRNDPQAGIAMLQALGAKYSVISWYDRNLLAGNAAWEDTAALFREAADVLHDAGLKLGYHDHEFEFEKVNGKYVHNYIFDAVPADRIEPELDTCWVHYAGIDPASKIREFSGRVTLMHLKDFECRNLPAGPLFDADGKGVPAKAPTREENGLEFRPLGRGRQDFASILAACEECGTEVVIVEQDRTYGDMTELEAAKISRDYLRDTFGI